MSTHAHPKVVVLDDWNNAFATSPHTNRLREQAEVTVYPDPAPSRAALLERLAGARAVICNRERTRFPADLLRALPDLKFISQTGGGAAHVDLPAATARGILVSVTSHGTGAGVVELTIGLMIATMRRFLEQDRALRAGRWPPLVGQELETKTLGIVGLGHLGTKVANVAQVLGMRVLAAGLTLTPKRAREAGAEFRDLESLFAESDVISIHLKLSEQTRGLIGAGLLAKMKPTAVLINTARGPIVDEGALVGALRSRRIAGAGIDVYDQEPLLENHPLLSCETALLTAHCGWVTDRTYDRYLSGAIENVEAFLRDGRPSPVLNPEVAPELNLTAYQR
jgi:phosphoglycerate dehydrogenase-like enzyme